MKGGCLLSAAMEFVFCRGAVRRNAGVLRFSVLSVQCVPEAVGAQGRGVWLPSRGEGQGEGFSVRLQPVRAPAAVGREGDVERVGVLHLLDDDALHLLFLFGQHAEVQLVVHLEYHL